MTTKDVGDRPFAFVGSLQRLPTTRRLDLLTPTNRVEESTYAGVTEFARPLVVSRVDRTISDVLSHIILLLAYRVNMSQSIFFN